MTQVLPCDGLQPWKPIVPPALTPGSVLAVVSPAGATTQGSRVFEQGLAYLEAQGFRPRLMPHAQNQALYLAGNDEGRALDLMEAFLDPEVKGIICARGGYGAMRILPRLDYKAIGNHPKVLIGFSDITALHVALWQRCGLIGFYGPMLTSNLIYPEEAHWDGPRLWPMVMGQWTYPRVVESVDPYVCISPGVGKGPLMGGNLSLLAALCGTPWQPQTRGTLLFIEDWKESYYSLDRQFQQLRLAGLLDGIAGLLLCDFSQIEPYEDPNGGDVPPLPRFLASLFDDLTARGIPVGIGFSIGHGAVTATLPIGGMAIFNSESGTLTLEESPVVVISS